MSHKWNVYKLFKNGKRAKAPFCVVEGESSDEAEKKFLDTYISNAGSSLINILGTLFARTCRKSAYTKKI